MLSYDIVNNLSYVCPKSVLSLIKFVSSSTHTVSFSCVRGQRVLICCTLLVCGVSERRQDITIVRSMKAPPAGVRLVLEAVCVMKGIKPDRIPDAATGKKVDDFWKPSLRVLGDMHFLESLISFDKVLISLNWVFLFGKLCALNLLALRKPLNTP